MNVGGGLHLGDICLVLYAQGVLTAILEIHIDSAYSRFPTAIRAKGFKAEIVTSKTVPKTPSLGSPVPHKVYLIYLLFMFLALALQFYNA